LEEEIGPSLKDTIADLNPTPIQSTLLAHSYSARLTNGMMVVVTILRPECSALLSGSGVPPSFDKSMVREYCGINFSDAVFIDFFSSLRRKCDFSAQRELFEPIVCDNPGCDLFRSRKIYHELCTTKLLTYENLESASIDEVQHRMACNTDTLARLLCQSWIYLVLRGNSFPVDPRPHNIILADNRILFTDCDFNSLTSSTKENLWGYLTATMADDPDRAGMYLLKEMEPPQRVEVDPEMFRSKFRQAAYFGALQPLLGRNSNTIAQLAFQHWKTALEYGYAPKAHLLCFYRGLFSIARIAYAISPYTDPLRAGMEEVRGDRILSQLREISAWTYWLQNSDKFATALINLPRMFDEALTRAVAAKQASPDTSCTSKRNGETANNTIIFLLAAILLLFRPSSMNQMPERLFLLLLVLLAGLVALRKFTD
jgi:predicted unusual protein kinase regulating ubiquinone biosynthesis (AarF/ABC1/UbiB family)